MCRSIESKSFSVLSLPQQTGAGLTLWHKTPLQLWCLNLQKKKSKNVENTWMRQRSFSENHSHNSSCLIHTEAAWTSSKPSNITSSSANGEDETLCHPFLIDYNLISCCWATQTGMEAKHQACWEELVLWNHPMYLQHKGDTVPKPPHIH